MRLKILLACLICTSMVGQDLKKKKKSSEKYQELYTVDKHSKERQGYYLKLNKISKDTLVNGMFDQGEKAGVWSYMDNKNSIYLKYDYDQEALIQNMGRTLESDSIQVKLGNEFRLKSIDRRAIFIGYKNEINDIIKEEMKLPSVIFQEAKSGMVVISFVINQTGEAVNFTIESTFNDQINEPVLNSLERITYGWVPAAINGASVVSKMYMMFNFSFITYSNIAPQAKIVDRADLIVVDLTYTMPQDSEYKGKTTKVMEIKM